MLSAASVASRCVFGASACCKLQMQLHAALQVRCCCRLVPACWRVALSPAFRALGSAALVLGSILTQLWRFLQRERVGLVAGPGDGSGGSPLKAGLAFPLEPASCLTVQRPLPFASGRPARLAPAVGSSTARRLAGGGSSALSGLPRATCCWRFMTCR